MPPEDSERERLLTARALDEVTEAARGEDRERPPAEVLGPAVDVSASATSGSREPPPVWAPPSPPDLKAVNESWDIANRSGALARFVSRADPDVQVKFNSDQVQLDNALISWVSEHFAATHRHYDRLIADMQQRLDDVDTRHRGLERELVRHVHEMARRIDVVLGEGEKGRVSHESALRSIRARLKELEEKLR